MLQFRVSTGMRIGTRNCVLVGFIHKAKATRYLAEELKLDPRRYIHDFRIRFEA